MKRHMRASLIAVAALSLAGSPLAAQSARQGTPPAEVKRDGAQATQILATEGAARLGISRAEAKVENKAAAMQSEGQMVRWIVIGAVVLLALVVVLAIAD
jgi:hypothetical protein